MKNRYKLGQKSERLTPLKVKSIDKDNFVITMVASTQDVDRHGDTVIQSGWKLDQFLVNPVILNSHRYNDATEVIANAIRCEVKGKGAKSRLEMDWKFAVNENPKAKVIFDLYAGGFLHASSVGFIPLKFRTAKNGDVDYFTIEESELLEVSAVSVPANAAALAKSKGIEVDDELIDDEDDEDEIEDEKDDKWVPPGCEFDEESGEPCPSPKPEEEEVTSKSAIYTRAIIDLNERETKALSRVSHIVKSMLAGEIAEEQKRKKINSAVRDLLSVK